MRGVPALARLSDATLASFVPLIDEAEIRAGGLLTREGIVSRQAFIVVDGTATVFVDGEEIAHVGPGDFVGEMGMLDKLPASATVRADGRVRVLVFGPVAFSVLLDQKRVVAAMAAQMSQRLRRGNAEAAAAQRGAAKSDAVA